MSGSSLAWAPPTGLRGTLRADHGTRSSHASAAGPFYIVPVAAAVPADADDVQALVAWAADEGVALVPRGAATGMPAGNVGQAVAVDLMPGLATIGTPDLDHATLTCGAGANAAAVARVAARAGFAFPPLPSSAELCTIGGMVANNAAGARSFRHGATRDWVAALDVVWPDGTRSGVDAGVTPGWGRELARELTASVGMPPRGWPQVRKNSSGFALDRFLPQGDALQLVVGSEGTLGIVVGVTVRLMPRPQDRGVVVVALPSINLIPEAAAAAAEAGASACELFGRRLLEMAALADETLPFDPVGGAAALLLFEVEGDAGQVSEGMSRLRRWATGLGLALASATDEEGRAHLWEVRHAASPLIARAADRGRRSTQFIEDSVVPVAAVPAYLRGLDEILERARTDAVVFGHAGDGNLHVNPLVDVGTPGWRARVRTILEETVELVAGLGGTLSGEHGDGRLRAPYLDRIWSPELMTAFGRVKTRLDPGGIMNPGVILPLPGQDPLEGLWAGPAPVGTAGC